MKWILSTDGDVELELSIIGDVALMTIDANDIVSHQIPTFWLNAEHYCQLLATKVP